MIEKTNRFQGFLEHPTMSRIRRNHGLEHATLHVLAERHPGVPMAGHSDSAGFWILGDLPIGEVEGSVQEALGRLQAGETKLAVHPNCGTNIATAGILTGLAAALAMFGVGKRLRDNFERLPTAMVFATLALIAAQPLGLMLQERVTTSGSPGDLRVVEIQPRGQGVLTAHRVITEG
jgi:Domain of unknown function (DUF6391)